MHPERLRSNISEGAPIKTLWKISRIVHRLTQINTGNKNRQLEDYTDNLRFAQKFVLFLDIYAPVLICVKSVGNDAF
jgi:hypothetical protein